MIIPCAYRKLSKSKLCNSLHILKKILQTKLTLYAGKDKFK